VELQAAQRVLQDELASVQARSQVAQWAQASPQAPGSEEQEPY
jgi:hypothetical protein